MATIKKITACFLPAQIKSLESFYRRKITGQNMRKILLSAAGIEDSMPVAGLGGASESTKKRVSKARHANKKALRNQK